MASPAQWKNRIVKYGEMAADQFIANPRNPRVHPQFQRDAMKGSLDTLGWIAPVIVNARSGFMIDGHERIFQALAIGDHTPVPYIEVDLSEDEETLALASFDFITTLATYERDTLASLLGEIETDNAAMNALIDSLAQAEGITPPDFDPVGIEEQPRLDEKTKCTCPNCGHEFTP